MTPLLEVLTAGPGAGIQDSGRPGWMRFGVPEGGAMDRHSLARANRLLGNADGAPCIEFLMHGGAVRLLRGSWIALAGARGSEVLGAWSASFLPAGTCIRLDPSAHGLWTYLAVPGGFAAKRVLGSAGAYPRGGIGHSLSAGDVLESPVITGPTSLARRLLSPDERRSFDGIPPIRVWRGPQWDSFPGEARDAFFSTDWEISPHSDRAGYRLRGDVLAIPGGEMVSEPTLVGSVQVPGSGQPIVTLRDGPTVGGYPKIALVHTADLDHLAQAAPGTRVRFVLAS